MGVIAALTFAEGISHKTKTAIMKLLLLTVFVAAASASEEVAEEAKPEAVKPVAPVFHQLGWPGARFPGFSGTCFGCRPGVAHPLGKRSAEADAEAGYYGYPYYGYGLGYGYGHALPGHSYTHVHRALGKRSAEADAEPGHYGYYGYPYGYYGYPYHFGYRAFAPLPLVGKAGVGGPPGGATSFVATSGAAGK